MKDLTPLGKSLDQIDVLQQVIYEKTASIDKLVAEHVELKRKLDYCKVALTNIVGYDEYNSAIEAKDALEQLEDK